MPDDLHSDLENELRRLRPVEPSAAMDEKIEAGLTRSAIRKRSQFSDQMLRTTLSAATAASILIVTLLASDYVHGTVPPAKRADEQSLTIADTPRLLAQLSTNPQPAFPSAATNPN